MGHFLDWSEVRKLCSHFTARGVPRCNWPLHPWIATHLFLPMRGAELLRIESAGVELRVGLGVGVVFAKDFLVLGIHFDAARNPCTCQSTVVGEADVVELLRVASRRLDQAHEQQRVLGYPELL